MGSTSVRNPNNPKYCMSPVRTNVKLRLATKCANGIPYGTTLIGSEIILVEGTN